MAHILKFWHTWNWAIHAVVWLFIAGTLYYANNQNAIANVIKDVADIQSQRLPERMATQEQLSKDTHEQLGHIEAVQGKIFDRINQIADRH